MERMVFGDIVGLDSRRGWDLTQVLFSQIDGQGLHFESFGRANGQAAGVGLRFL